jgi:hypothetical protein
MDDVAREYLLIGLGVGELEEGVVDAYFGPPELADEARAAGQSAAELAARAETLRASLDGVEDRQRARWLDRQLLALATLARNLAGERLPYLEEVERCFDARPEPTPPSEYTEARQALDELLPGSGDLRQRLAQRDDRLTVAPDRLSGVIDWLIGELRRSAAQQFDIPAGEELSVELVTGKPWGAYNWYHGKLRSLIEYNTDLPVRATALVGTLAHETFPGHHLEHASKEARLLRDQGRAEAAIQLINTPEAYVSEGLAEVGVRFVAPETRWQELLLGACERGGIALTAADAQREWLTSRQLERLGGSSGDAALQLHVAGRSPEQVVAFLEQEALAPRERAQKSLEFLTHPLWRTYVFCYAGGERLLNQWIDQAPTEDEARSRFARLLTEQLTPSGIAEETARGASQPA